MAAGVKGTIDWAGYSVGEPPPPAPAGGFRGLLDLAGYSVGKSSICPGGVLAKMTQPYQTSIWIQD